MTSHPSHISHAIQTALNLPLDTPAITIRQPWAWLIVNGFKDIENRTRPTKIRGPIIIHAAKGMTRAEYCTCQWFIEYFSSLRLPPAAYLPRSAIVGKATILDSVTHHHSDWFEGPHGYVLANPEPCTPIPCRGSLGWFYPACPNLPKRMVAKSIRDKLKT